MVKSMYHSFQFKTELKLVKHDKYAKIKLLQALITYISVILLLNIVPKLAITVKVDVHKRHLVTKNITRCNMDFF